MQVLESWIHIAFSDIIYNILEQQKEGLKPLEYKIW